MKKLIMLASLVILAGCGSKGGDDSAPISSDKATVDDPGGDTNQNAAVVAAITNRWNGTRKEAFMFECTSPDPESTSSKSYTEYFCSCILGKIMPRYTYEYFDAYSSTVRDEITADGSIKECKTKANANEATKEEDL